MCLRFWNDANWNWTNASKWGHLCLVSPVMLSQFETDWRARRYHHQQHHQNKEAHFFVVAAVTPLRLSHWIKVLVFLRIILPWQPLLAGENSWKMYGRERTKRGSIARNRERKFCTWNQLWIITLTLIRGGVTAMMMRFSFRVGYRGNKCSLWLLTTREEWKSIERETSERMKSWKRR